MESGEAEMMPRPLDWKYGTCSRHRQLMHIGFRLEGFGPQQLGCCSSVRVRAGTRL